MKIQLNTQSLAEVQALTKSIGDVNNQIRVCRNARASRCRIEAEPQDPNRELPLRQAKIDAWHTQGASGHLAESQAERDAMFDIIEILQRASRDRLIARLDALGVVLTDQPDFGPAPAWPDQPA